MAKCEIMNQGNIDDDIQVSIYCLAFNHKKFIKTAIESLLMQETSFRYMIYIHDDASTDGTQDIIREYANAYPDKIVAVLQEENQHSQGVKIVSTFLRPLFRGRYVAICEGDDFWINEKKLQKQFDFMERNPQCTFCCHGGLSVSAETQKPLTKNSLGPVEKFFGIEDAISGLGRNVLTNSFFYRTEFMDIVPTYRAITPCGDYTLPIVCAEKGVLGYLPEIMSAYRVLSNPTSVTVLMRTNKEFRKRYVERYDLMLCELDHHTNHQYASLIEKERQRIWLNYYVQIGDKSAVKKKYSVIIGQYPLAKRAVLWLEVNFPALTMYLRKMKLKLRLQLVRERIDIRNNGIGQWTTP